MTHVFECSCNRVAVSKSFNSAHGSKFVDPKLVPRGKGYRQQSGTERGVYYLDRQAQNDESQARLVEEMVKHAQYPFTNTHASPGVAKKGISSQPLSCVGNINTCHCTFDIILMGIE